MRLHTQYRLPVFIALSLAVHLVWFIGNRSWSLHPPQQDSRQMSVHISEPRQPDHRQKQAPHTAQAPAKKPDSLTEHKPQNHSQASPQAPQQTRQQDFDQLTRARILGQIRQRLVQHFVYPSLARRQGWQGRVLLGFRLDGKGGIQHIHVKQSSGYAILDDSAITAMRKIGQVSRDGIGLLDQFGQLEIPIIYRLEG